MSTRSPQFGRAGSRERRPAAEDASTEERAKTRNDDINRRQRLGAAMRDMNRSGGPAKSNDK
jgi:hypothetical protein